MAIKRETTSKTELGFKGIFLGIDDEGYHVEDVKSGEKEVLGLDEFKQFVGKEVLFGMTEIKKTTL